MIYILIFGMLLFFSFCKDDRDRIFKFNVICLIVFSGFRGLTVGKDTAGGYYSYYNTVLNGGHLTWVEPAWELLNSISIRLGFGYQGVLVFSTMLTIIPIYIVLKNTESINKNFALFIYYGMYSVLYSFNMVRQCIAISFCLWAYQCFVNKKWMRSGIIFAAAFLFHKSCVFFLAILLFRIWKPKLKHIVWFSISTIIIGMLLSSNVIFMLAGKFASNLLQNDGYSGFRDSMILPLILTIAVNAFYLFILRKNYDQLKEDDWAKLLILGLLVTNLTIRLGQGTRLALYFMQSQIVFIPKYIRSIDSLKTRRNLRLFFAVYLLANFLRILNSQWDSLVPYTNYLMFWR